MRWIILASMLVLLLPLAMADSAPKITLHSPPKGYITSSPNITIEFTAVDDTDTNMSCFLLLNSEKISFYALNNTKYFHYEEDLAQTDYEWNITCSDDSGHNSTSESRIFIIDYSPPVIASVKITSLKNDSVEIIIITDEKTRRKIDYGLSPFELYMTTNFTTRYYLHLPIAIANLTPGTDYYYNVTVCDISNLCAKGKMTYNFTTLGNKTVQNIALSEQAKNESSFPNTTTQNTADSSALNSTLNETLAKKEEIVLFTKSTFNTLIVAAAIALAVYFIVMTIIRRKNRL